MSTGHMPIVIVAMKLKNISYLILSWEGFKKVEICFCEHDQDGMGQGSGELKREYHFFCRLPFSQTVIGPIAISFSQPSVTLEICVEKRLVTVGIDVNK